MSAVITPSLEHEPKPAPILLPSPAVQTVLEARFGRAGTFGRAASIVPSADIAPISPYRGTAAKGKPRTRRYREDWNNDSSLFHEVANAVAGVERRNDEEALAWTMQRDGLGRSVLNRPSVTIAPGITVTRNPEAAVTLPTPSKRELQRRLSKRQRQIVRAFELWQAGVKWDEIARAMNVPRATMRAWRAEIVSMLGEYELSRNKDAPRDPDTKRFARRVGRERFRETSPERA